jgi:hypothetical protein
MADEDQDPSRPNLEPPSLFGRKKRADSDPESEVDDEPTDLLPVSDATWMFEPPAEDEPEPVPVPERRPEPGPIDFVLPAEGGVPLFADELEEVEEEPAPVKPRHRPRREPRPPKQQRAKREKPARVAETGLPTVSGWVAASVTGVVVGLLLVGMTAGSLQACEAVRGTSTCGGTGVPILLVIMAVLIAVGGFLLRLFHVPDPTTTSFLAVGMVAVIALLFLLDFLLSLWMLLVIPVIAVAMYLLAFWVTTAFVEPAKEHSEL